MEEGARKRCSNSECSSQILFYLSKRPCLNCGLQFCSKCTSRTIVVPRLRNHQPMRVCDECCLSIALQTSNHRIASTFTVKALNNLSRSLSLNLHSDDKDFLINTMVEHYEHLNTPQIQNVNNHNNTALNPTQSQQNVADDTSPIALNGPPPVEELSPPLQPCVDVSKYRNLSINLILYVQKLPVRELKQTLVDNHVRASDCLEKSELIDRLLFFLDSSDPSIVKRVFKEPEPSPKSDSKEDDLCKICYDNRINCVILECGHVSVCITCGRLLKECPICRQRINRLVIIYKA
eukprot:TRINITY_DN17372_c0_g1_i1.p1 TRINITY_DN17372_c0_g1~~TRINITY_DN17372_c0_g1_i1.p1  ORF type:complete len:292 (-),score=34.54 TRINITY_DN17372_c0_g1_i1:91-966(-)